MKKIFYILVAASMAVVACQKQSAEPMYSIEETDHGTYIFTIKAVNDAADPAVKSDYDASGHFSWSAGDAISVLFHKGDDNKFFTLTTTGTGKSATFSGEITSGYEIGASDGSVSDKKVWALFPASNNHTYAATDPATYPNFYVQPEVDFTAPGAHFSANVPMYALAADVASGLSFANLASTYKFIVNGIKDGVSKVKLTVYNQTTFGLSGLWPIYDDGKLIINYNYASPGSANSTLTYTSSVTDNKAEFYVSCHGTFGSFQPNVTVSNCATGIPIKTFVAANKYTMNSVSSIQPITLDVSEANGGSYFVPAINIDGSFSDWDVASNAALTNGVNYTSVSGSGTYWKDFKVAYDEKYIYFYVKRNFNADLWTGGYFWFKFDTDNDGDYDDNKKFYIQPFTLVGEVKSFLSSPAAKDVLGTASASFSLSCAGIYDATDVEIEVAALRSDVGINKDDVIGFASNANKSAGTLTIPGTLTIAN